MHLTRYSDYSLRVLIYLALKGDETSTIKEIAESYDISKNHLMKIVHNLSLSGHIKTVRGRTGGISLAKPPSQIILGEVIRDTEDDFSIVECFDEKKGECSIKRYCKLKHIMGEALFAFMNVLDKYTLEDILAPQSSLRKTLGIKVLA